MKRRCFLIFLFFGYTYLLNAQTLSQAKVWYLKGDYTKAVAVFKEELKKKPNNASLNLWYGVCLLKTGNIEASLNFLKTASEKRLPEADRFLAQYYHEVFQPDTAQMYLEKYLQNPKVNQEKKDAAQPLKTAIELSIEQIKHVEDVCFIDSVIVPKTALYSTIKLSQEAGNFVSTHSVFAEIPVSAGGAYFPERNDRACYAKKIPGKNLDLVARHRILSAWGETESLPDIINSEADECNPYYLSDGVTLYFASNGHESMGGYDLFVTRMNLTTNSYLLPNRLNMPFNSRANDYFLLVDEYKNRGFLATDRNQKEGFAAIYTFIPNPEKILLQGKSIKELLDLAQIRSIKESQKGKNLDSLLRCPFIPTQYLKEPDTDFVFTINDEHSYSKESDFQSDEARKLYTTYRSEYQKYLRTQQLLEKKRAAYLQAPSERQKEIGADILKLESDVQRLQRNLPAMEKKIRNTEITKLSKPQ